MERYLLFKGDVYYPSGGWHDFVGYFATIEEASEAAGRIKTYNWAHVVDTETGEIIELGQP